MILSLIRGAFGCSGGNAKPWQSLTYHVTSSVLSEGCHFVLIRDGDGGILLSGVCFEDGAEVVREEKKAISAEAVAAIEAMETERSKKAGKKPFRTDGRETSVNLCFFDGTERKISLPASQLKLLRELLGKELAQRK